MISDVVHLQLHTARHADLMREADHERLIRTLRRPRHRHDPATSTRLEPFNTSIAGGGAATAPRITATESA